MTKEQLANGNKPTDKRNDERKLKENSKKDTPLYTCSECKRKVWSTLGGICSNCYGY